MPQYNVLLVRKPLFPFRLVFVLLACSLPTFSSLVSAQTKGDLYFGYSFVSSDLKIGSVGAVSSSSAGRASLNGWEASASVRLFLWIRAVGDVSAGYGTVPVVFSSPLGSAK